MTQTTFEGRIKQVGRGMAALANELEDLADNVPDDRILEIPHDRLYVSELLHNHKAALRHFVEIYNGNL